MTSSSPSPDQNSSPAPVVCLPQAVRPVVLQERVLHLVKDLDEPPEILAPGFVYWEIGDGGGLYYISDVQPGLRANVGISIKDPYYRGRRNDWRHKDMARYLFSAYHFQSLRAFIAQSNTASQALAERLGYSKEGVMRCYGWYKGRLEDWVSYSLVRGDV